MSSRQSWRNNRKPTSPHSCLSTSLSFPPYCQPTQRQRSTGRRWSQLTALPAPTTVRLPTGRQPSRTQQQLLPVRPVLTVRPAAAEGGAGRGTTGLRSRRRQRSAAAQLDQPAGINDVSGTVRCCVDDEQHGRSVAAHVASWDGSESVQRPVQRLSAAGWGLA